MAEKRIIFVSVIMCALTLSACTDTYSAKQDTNDEIEEIHIEEIGQGGN